MKKISDSKQLKSLKEVSEKEFLIRQYSLEYELQKRAKHIIYQKKKGVVINYWLYKVMGKNGRLGGEKMCRIADTKEVQQTLFMFGNFKTVYEIVEKKCGEHSFKCLVLTDKKIDRGIV